MFKRSKFIVAAGAVSAVMAFSQAAQADTWNFAKVADNDGLTTPFDITPVGTTTGGGEGGWNSIIGTGVGLFDTTASNDSAAGDLYVVGSASNSQGGTTVQAYFDSDAGKFGAGLGVCSGFDIASPPQCFPTSDDNAGAIGGTNGVGDETLTLTFSEQVSLDQLILAGEGHIPFIGSLKINGVVTVVTAAMNGIVNGVGIGTIFSFQYIPAAGSSNEFYISAVSATERPQEAIPLPAAFPLFLSGLGGMGLLGWRRRRKAAA